MFERYTVKAKRVIFHARSFAGKHGAAHIAPEHLLLGLLFADRELMNRVMPRMEAVAELQAEIEGNLIPGTPISTKVEMSFSPDSRSVLDFATVSADRLKREHVGTIHVLLGILRISYSPAAVALEPRMVDTASLERIIEHHTKD
jgi:ATP-dependent Clp protease ATP-binding subunit ClpC